MRYVNSDGKEGEVACVPAVGETVSVGLKLVEGIQLDIRKKMSLETSRARLLKECRNPREVFWE